MMPGFFSSRTPDLTALSATELEQNRRDFKRAGYEFADLTQTNPSTLGLIPKAAAAALASVDLRQYQPFPLGLPEARQAVAHEIGAHPQNVALTASTSEAYSYALKLLCEPGDKVLCAAPGYPLLDSLVQLEGVDLEVFSLLYEGDWFVDRPQLQALIDDRTRALFIVSPNNPTGHFYSPEDLNWIQALCVRRRIALVVDEVFACYPLSAQDQSPVALKASQGLVLSFDGLSKRCGLPGAKLAWVVFGGDPKLRQAALERWAFIADAYLSVAGPVQQAVQEILRLGPICRESIFKRLRASQKSISEFHTKDALWTPLPVDAGWVQCLRLPLFDSDLDMAKSLLSHGVFLHPGSLFGFPRGGAFFVLSLLSPHDTLIAGLEAMQDWLNTKT